MAVFCAECFHRTHRENGIKERLLCIKVFLFRQQFLDTLVLLFSFQAIGSTRELGTGKREVKLHPGFYFPLGKQVGKWEAGSGNWKSVRA